MKVYLILFRQNKLVVKQKNKLFVCILTFALNACTPAYIPNVINTPMLTNKGEIQAAVYTGTSNFDQQFAYAPTDHFGLMLNGSFAYNLNTASGYKHMHKFVELGAGYYTKLENNGRFEVFGGFGGGNLKSKNISDLWNETVNANSYRIFIQPSIGASTQLFDGSLATRLVMVNIYQGSHTTTGYLIEPALTGKVGYKYVKAVAQLGLSIPAGNSVKFAYQPFMFSLGIQAFLFKNHEN
ncbi:MAG: hypothetical protein IPG89_04965 [Bacteroidetes bacterium]|nr:hypothetical protein [Bacteroidota bacterium]